MGGAGTAVSNLCRGYEVSTAQFTNGVAAKAGRTRRRRCECESLRRNRHLKNLYIETQIKIGIFAQGFAKAREVIWPTPGSQVGV